MLWLFAVDNSLFGGDFVCFYFGRLAYIDLLFDDCVVGWGGGDLCVFLRCIFVGCLGGLANLCMAWSLPPGLLSDGVVYLEVGFSYFLLFSWQEATLLSSYV